MGFDALSPWHLLILAAVFVVLFGSRKLPDAARALGKSMRIFKAETKALRDGDDIGDQGRQVQAAQQATVRQPSAQQPPAPVATPGSDDTVSDAVSDAPLAEAQRNQRST